MSETSEILKAVLERLQWAENQGFCTFDRLNSGKIIIPYEDKQGNKKVRAVKLCKKGTADVIIIQPSRSKQLDCGDIPQCRVTYIETKTTNGVLSEDQEAFKHRVQSMGARYLTVTDVDELEVLW